MSRLSLRFIPCLLASALAFSACQTLAGNQAATLDIDDPATRATVTATLAGAVNRARIELGPSDGAQTAVITVLPPPLGPLETNSTAMPVRFDIELRGGVCYAVRHDTGQAYLLKGVTCKPAG